MSEDKPKKTPPQDLAVGFDPDFQASLDLEFAALDLDGDPGVDLTGPEVPEESLPPLDEDATVSSHGYALDDFEAPLSEPKPPAAPAPPPPKDEPPEDQTEARKKIRLKMAIKRALLFGPPALLLVGFLGFGLVHWITHRPAPALPHGQAMLRHRIVLPHHQEKLDFFLLSKAEQEKNLIILELEVDFTSPDRYDHFQKERVLFRDVVYRFLASRTPARNSLKDWQQLIQKELPNLLNEKLPECRADAIRLSHLEKI